MRARIIQGVCAVVAMLGGAFQLSAIEDLKIKVQGSDVVLHWRSAPGASYMVQHRTNLDAATPWVTLATSHPAASGTNRTAFTHAGVVQSCGGGALQTLSESPTQAEANAPGATADGKKGAVLRWWDLWQIEGRSPAAWETEKRPPLPWEWQAWNASPARQGLLGLNAMFAGPDSSMQSLSGNCPGDMGFYRVVQAGVRFFGMTNGQVVSGVISLPVEIGIVNPGGALLEAALAPLQGGAPDTYPSGIELYVLDASNRAPTLVWDTHRTTNGTYTLAPSVKMKGGSVVSGPAVTVVVSNRIQMPKISDVVVNALPIYARIDQPNAAYTITIRNAQGQVVHTLTGNAVNHVIDRVWNGLDAQGNNWLIDHTYLEVTISYNPSYSYRVWVFYEDSYINGNWLIAYTKGLYSPVNEAQLDNYMQQISEFAAEEGLAYSPYLQIRNGPNDWESMTNLLAQPNTRNFYYWGHGGPSALGFGSNDPNNGIGAGQLRRMLGNVVVTNLNEIQIRQAYRFVWLDGCDTGTKSSAWPQTFGIQPVQLDGADFDAMGGARRAFLGWKKPINWLIFSSVRFAFAEDFFDRWISQGTPLLDALQQAAPGTIGLGELADLQIWGDTQLTTQGH